MNWIPVYTGMTSFMPELPEVQTIANDLNKVMLGRPLLKITTPWPGSIQTPVAAMRRRLIGKSVKQITRVGKTLVLSWGDVYLLIHLKMTGQLVWQSGRQVLAGGHPIVNAGSGLPNKFTRVILEFQGGRLFFNDVRKFGWLRLADNVGLAAYRQHFGLEPLERGFGGRQLRQALVGKQKSNIKAALLDQTKLAGLGNIYVDEALFAAGLKPQRLVSSLNKTDWPKLAAAIKRVLKNSIKHRGTSFSDYRDGQGQKGNFSQHLRVYGRARQNCYHCGGPISKARLAGRGTHWCEHCQH